MAVDESSRPDAIFVEDDPLDILRDDLQERKLLYPMPQEEWGELRATLHRRIANALRGGGRNIIVVPMEDVTQLTTQCSHWTLKVLAAVCHELLGQIMELYNVSINPNDVRSAKRILATANINADKLIEIFNVCRLCLVDLDAVLFQPIDVVIANALGTPAASIPSPLRVALRRFAGACFNIRQQVVQAGAQTDYDSLVQPHRDAAIQEGVSEDVIQAIVENLRPRITGDDGEDTAIERL